MLRSHTCGELNKKDVEKSVTLCGFVDSYRKHGKIGFLNLRDRYGITQLFLDKNVNKPLSRESVVLVKGKVKSRPRKEVNKKMKTGDIEVAVSQLEILNDVKELPFELDEDIESTEETRLKYRYLDLRKERMQKNLIMRYKLIKGMRDFLDKENFVEIETPILAKSTPEGARDYLVPSRIHKGKFYALPQSPQLFKQLLMIAGFDKYFQIARCLRDEDLRADRQPEFTQMDLEMSFVEEEDVFSIIERMLKEVWKKVLNKDLKIPFQRMTYDQAMKKYKSDKPDLRKNKNEHKFLWVTDFPLLEYCETQKRYVAAHHPFTGVTKKDLQLLDKDPKKAKSRAYDLVFNGYEIASGSIRIHDRELQRKIFKALKISDKEARDRFGFFLDALEYAVPHGGIAIGLDRVIAIIAKENSIREVIAFPKNKEAKDLMLDSPSEVSKVQLKELGLK